MINRRRLFIAAVVSVACSFTLFSLSSHFYFPNDVLPHSISKWHGPVESAPASASPSPSIVIEIETLLTADETIIDDPTVDEPENIIVDISEASLIVNETVTSSATDDTVTPLSLEYATVPGAGETCSRFSPTYLEDFHARAASYCTSESPAKLTCFHRPSGFDKKTDSFCYAEGATLNLAARKFHLNCKRRKFSDEEKSAGLLPFAKLPLYWYETGPGSIFSLDVRVGTEPPPPATDKEDDGEKGKRSEPEPESELEPETNSESLSNPEAPTALATPEGDTHRPTTPAKTYLLVRREGEGNPWHCLMEIFSAYLTFDALRMPGGPSDRKRPLFHHPNDSEDTQVVILDDRVDGPYFDLWTMFARRKPMRLRELIAQQSASTSLIAPANLIVPLAGGSNPFWKEDNQAEQCINSPLLNVFSQRVLDFYSIDDKSTPFREKYEPIVVTFVDRRERRSLQHQATLLAELAERNPRIEVRVVDFAGLSFAEQVRVARETDVLVGVHGAGLTHLMFMRQGAGAVVEIQPEGLEHHGFKNVAGMRGLGYFRTHARIIPQDMWREKEEKKDKEALVQDGKEEKEEVAENKVPKSASEPRALQKRDEWHFLDIAIEKERFFEAVEAAIKYMYNQGPWSFDVI